MPTTDHLADLLPDLPADQYDTAPDVFTLLDGHEWIGRLPTHSWRAVDVWGAKGWNLGCWPYQIAAHHDGPGVYGLAVYTEGDVRVTAYPSRAERDAATDAEAVFWWACNGNGPADVAEGMSPIPAAYCGPYTG